MKALSVARKMILELWREPLLLGLLLFFPVALVGVYYVAFGQTEEGLVNLAEALALVEETDERHWEAEIHRLKGELLLMQGDDAEAEASFHRAIEGARRQSAKSWELRAATSLARLWGRQGRTDEARQALAEIYGWFTEGFDTPDLKEAEVLLAQLEQR
jgi:predicted ATPase